MLTAVTMGKLYYSASAIVAGEAPSEGAPAAIATLHDTWAEYIAGFAAWTGFLTLTFDTRDRLHDVTRPEAEYLWRRLVQCLNRDLFGHSYTRIVGHSYFAYALAFEYQQRGALHMHALVSRRTNWELINLTWRRMAGIVKVKPVTESLGAAHYLCKYITKGGDVLLYRPAKLKEPTFKPMWYRDPLAHGTP
jgi:hypothetical protein